MDDYTDNIVDGGIEPEESCHIITPTLTALRAAARRGAARRGAARRGAARRGAARRGVVRCGEMW